MSHPQHRILSERRVHHRFEDLRASLVQLDGNNNGIVLNISEGGMAVLFAEELDVTTLRALRFQAPEFGHWMDLSAEVAWISDSRKQAGIRFKDLSETARTQLRAGISIATTRARRADQAKQADMATSSQAPVDSGPAPSATAEGRVDVSNSMPPSLAKSEDSVDATDSMPASFTTADSKAPIASEAEQDSNKVPTNSFAEETAENEGLLPAEVGEGALDSQLPAAPSELEAREKPILSAAKSKKDIQTQQLPTLPDTKPQKTSALIALAARSTPPMWQKSALAKMPARNLLPNSRPKQPSDGYRGIVNRADISYRKWAAVAAVAILASLLAFLVGWLIGDPNRIKLGH